MQLQASTKNWQLGILSRDSKHYAALLTSSLPAQVKLCCCTDDPAEFASKDVEIILGDPDLIVQIINDCANAQWVQSSFAGNAPLLRAGKRDYKLTGVKGIFDQQMREYVFSYLLYFARNIQDFTNAQHRPAGKWAPPPFNTLTGKTLGIAGAGDIAAGLVEAARVFGLKVVGLNRSGQSSADYAALYTPDNKLAFAATCDYIVSLLPDTPATKAFIDGPFLAAMPEHAVLINAGRGVVVDDDALINALTCGQIRAAVLDVFINEPLADNHPYWTLPNAYITQHTAAISRTDDVAIIFNRNLRRFLHAEPLLYNFDFVRGY